MQSCGSWGNFWQGFAVGAVSSLAGSGMQAAGLDAALLPLGTGLAGAGTAALTGGDAFAGFMAGYGIGKYNHSNKGRWTQTNTGEAQFDLADPLKEVTVIGKTPIKISKHYNRIGFVPLDEKVGFQMANYKMNVNITSYKNQLDINANSFNTPVADGYIVPIAKASLIVNGQVVSSKPLQTSGAYISSMYQQPVGSASFNLSNNSNDISIKFQAGWTMFYYGGGAYVPVYHPVFFPKTININQTIQIR
jgi:hypothetical protein